MTALKFNWEKTDYKNYITNDVARAYDLLFNQDTDKIGFINVCTLDNKNSIKIVKSFKMCEYKTELSGIYLTRDKNYYFTPNTKQKPQQHASQYLLSLNAIVIDIDSHDHIPTAKQTDSLLKYLLSNLEKNNVPMPSFVSRTGRGLQVYYALEQCAYTLKWLYDIIVNSLSSVFENILNQKNTIFKVDKGATNKASGLFRLIGSHNTKSQSIGSVDIIQNCRYDINELKDLLNIELCNKIKNKKQVCNNNCELYTRAAFLEELAKKQTAPNLRDEIAWNYYNIQVQKNKIAAREKLIDLNNSFFEPLKKNELDSIMRCIDKRGFYNIGKNKFYSYFNVNICENINIQNEYTNKKYSNHSKAILNVLEQISKDQKQANKNLIAKLISYTYQTSKKLNYDDAKIIDLIQSFNDNFFNKLTRAEIDKIIAIEKTKLYNIAISQLCKDFCIDRAYYNKYKSRTKLERETKKISKENKYNEIKSLWKTGKTQKQLSEKFNCCQKTIFTIFKSCKERAAKLKENIKTQIYYICLAALILKYENENEENPHEWNKNDIIISNAENQNKNSFEKPIENNNDLLELQRFLIMKNRAENENEENPHEWSGNNSSAENVEKKENNKLLALQNFLRKINNLNN